MTAPRIPTELESAIQGGRVYTRDYHKQALEYVAEQAERKAAAEIYRLQGLLEISAADRVRAVLLALRQVRRPRGGTHDGTCWQRHAHCLASRIYDLLDGAEDCP